jgi:hypothetical protein
MPSAVFKEEEEKEKKRREEEKKKKEESAKQEVQQKVETKKEEVQKESSSSPFTEAKPITEVGFMKQHIKGTLASEKYEPVVRESLAVRLGKQEMEKESERIAEEAEKISKRIEEEQQKLKQIETEVKKAEKEKLEVEKAKKIQIEKEKERIKAEHEKQKEQIREMIKKEREQMSKIMEEMRKKGMIEPVQDLAKQLIIRELKRGNPPRLAIRRVLAVLTRLGFVKTKKERSGMIKFLKSLIGKS